MAKKSKSNGKARPLVIERPVHADPNPRSTEETAAIVPGPMRTSADLLAALDTVGDWLKALEMMIQAGCSRPNMATIAYDSHRIVEVVAQGLRDGRMPAFLDTLEEDSERRSTWVDDARRVLAHREDPDVAELLLEVAQRGRAPAEARAESVEHEAAEARAAGGA